MTITELTPGHRALRRNRLSLVGAVYLVTTTTSERRPLFAGADAATVVCRCFADRRLLGEAELLAWVLMPDHAHWLVELGEAGDLPGLVRRLKSGSACMLNRHIGDAGTVWAPAYHDRLLRNWQEVRHAAAYVIGNPLRAGLVENIHDYPYWYSAWSERR